MKIQSLFRIAGATLALTTSMAFAGGMNGGGGFTILCRDGKYYALDYVATEQEVSDLAPPVLAAKSGDEILGLISAKLDHVLPEMGHAFHDFLKRNQDEGNLDTARIWVDGKNPLGKLPDEERTRVPVKCLDASNQPQTFQAVIRTRRESGIVYERDGAQMHNLELTDPLQVSFTYVHEFLRDYTDDSQILMQVNRFFHSAAFYKMSAAHVKMVLTRYGLDYNAKDAALDKLNALSTVRFEWDGKLATKLSQSQDVSVGIYICAHGEHGFKDKYSNHCISLAKSEPSIHVEGTLQIWAVDFYSDIGTAKDAYESKPLVFRIEGAKLLNLAEEVRDPGVEPAIVMRAESPQMVLALKSLELNYLRLGANIEVVGAKCVATADRAVEKCEGLTNLAISSTVSIPNF